MKSPSPLPADLPTAPVGRQQIIDIKAGAILRHNRKHRRLFGCPLTPLLTAIVFFKALVFSIWLYREFNTFDFRCAIVSPILEGSEQLLIRKKRFSIDFDDFENLPPRVMTLENADESDDPDIIEQRERVKKKRPLFGGGFKKISDEEEDDGSSEGRHTPATTIVTLTNTQIVPIADGKQGTIRMKTIRNRIENVGGEDEEFVEIDIGSAPRIYVSKIRSRHGESPLLTTRSAPDENVDGEKKKGKGKGRKKDKNRKGLGRKKSKNLENNQIGGFEPTTQAPTQSTKGPRHLFSPPQDVLDPDATTTSRPHRSDFLGGVIDPLDENFTNQGEIRGYPMQKASKKPKGGRKKNKNKTDSGIRLSEEIKMMWGLNELNYTTLTMPKTTEVTQQKANETKAQSSNPILTSLGDETNTNRSKNSGGKKGPNEDKWWKDSRESEDEDEWPMDGSVEIENKVDRNGNGQFEPEKEVEYGHPYRPEIPESPGHRSSTERLIEEEDEARRNPPTQRWHNRPEDFMTRKPAHPLPRDSLTETVWTNPANQPTRAPMGHDQETTPIIFDDLNAPIDFKAQLDSFGASATCIMRTLFDIWCCFQLICLIPFTFGLCTPRWCLFISHVVMDFVCLVIGFLISITMAVLSLVLYCMVDQMDSAILVHSLLIAFAIDILLLIYSLLVVTTFRCCDRLVAKYCENDEADTNGVSL